MSATNYRQVLSRLNYPEMVQNPLLPWKSQKNQPLLKLAPNITV